MMWIRNFDASAIFILLLVCVYVFIALNKSLFRIYCSNFRTNMVKDFGVPMFRVNSVTN